MHLRVTLHPAPRLKASSNRLPYPPLVSHCSPQGMIRARNLAFDHGNPLIDPKHRHALATADKLVTTSFWQQARSFTNVPDLVKFSHCGVF